MADVNRRSRVAKERDHRRARAPSGDPTPPPAASSGPTITSTFDVLAHLDAIGRALRPVIEHDPAAQAQLRQAIEVLVKIATPEDEIPF